MRPSRDRAVEWLRVYLAERGAVLSSEVNRDAGGGYQPHRQDLGVRLQQVPGVGARHTWLM
jgi:hypothetical protein